MDQDGEKRVRSSDDEVDRLSNLQESLIFEVLLKLTTKDVVKTSVLSSRWRNLWRYVPGLDLKYDNFTEYKAFVSFVDRFLDFNSESQMQKFKLILDCYKEDTITWFNILVKRKVQHIQVLDKCWGRDKKVKIPLTVYTCDSLVSLNLTDVALPPSPEFVSLPSLKVIELITVKIANGLAFEMLISGCPVLERLKIRRSFYDNVKVLRVRSQSLLSFTHVGENIKEDQVVEIDAPVLEYLELREQDTGSFIINNAGNSDLVKVVMDIKFKCKRKDQPKRNMIRNFLFGISSVKVMNIFSETLKAIYNYSRYEQLPLFCNLSSLRINFYDYRLETLPIFLESCPNLKSLSLGFKQYSCHQPVDISPGPHCFLPTLESVEIVEPMIYEKAEMKLVRYFLENSTILKKLTLILYPSRKKEASDIFNKLLAVPRLSTSCQVVVL